MGKPLAVISSPSDIVYMQEYRLLTRVAWLRPNCTSPTRCGAWCWWGVPQLVPGYSHVHFDGGNFILADGHARYKKTTAERSGDYGLSPPDDHWDAKGNGHSGTCGKSYTVAL